MKPNKIKCLTYLGIIMLSLLAAILRDRLGSVFVVMLVIGGILSGILLMGEILAANAGSGAEKRYSVSAVNILRGVLMICLGLVFFVIGSGWCQHNFELRGDYATGASLLIFALAMASAVATDGVFFRLRGCKKA